MDEEPEEPANRVLIVPACEAHFYAPIVWVDPAPLYYDAGLEEGGSSAFQFDDKLGYGRENEPLEIDDIEEALASLSPQEAEILMLTAKGLSPEQIVWTLNVSGWDVKNSIIKGLGVLSPEDLLKAGLITEVRAHTIEGGYARSLARTLQCVVDARVMRVVIDGPLCGLQIMLATGEHAHLWFCNDHTLSDPGWAALEREGGSFCDDVEELNAAVRSLVGRRRSSAQAMRQVLHDIAEKAIDLLDYLENPEEEYDEAEEWESEDLEDQDEVPLTLNPRYQTERQVAGPPMGYEPDATELDDYKPDGNEQLEMTPHSDRPPAASHLDTNPKEAEIWKIIARVKVIEREIESAPDSIKGLMRVCLKLELERLRQKSAEFGFDSTMVPANSDVSSIA